MPTPFRRLLLIGLSASVLPPGVQAASFCAGDSGELVGALTAASLNAEADVVRLQAGTYVAGSATGFTANPGNRNLEISGGWSAGCLFRPRGARSVIDGQYQRSGLSIHGSLSNGATIRVAHLRFIRGVGEEAGGLSISSVGTGNVRVEVEDCRFHDNHLGDLNEYIGGGLRVVADEVQVMGSVFTANHADIGAGAAAITCFGQLGAFTGNTVAGNTAAFGTVGDRGGVQFGGNCLMEVANNIFWNNEGHDVRLSNDEVVLRNNDIDDLDGLPAPGSSGNVSVDPQFVSAGILRLRRSSPLIDAGFDSTLLGLPAFSHDGGPRVVGAAIDIGAYELDVLFGHGFDPQFGLRQPPATRGSQP